MALDPEDDVAVAEAPGQDVSAQAEEQDRADQRELQQVRPAPGGYALPQRPVSGLTRAPPPTPLAVRAQPRASFADIDPNAQPMAVYGRPAPPPPDAGFWSNAAEITKKTGYATMAEIMGAARYFEQQMSSDPEAKTWIERQREALEEEASKEYSDPRLQRIMTASLMSAFGGSTDAKGNHIPSPGEVGWFNYFLYNTVGMAPTVALALLPASTVAKVSTKLLSSLGAAARTAKAVGAGAGIAESAGQFGLQNMGSLYNSVTGEVMKTPEAEMMKSPAYAELRRGGYSDDAAKAELIKQTIPPMALQALALGGLVGAGFTGMAARGAISPLLGGAVKNRILGAGMGATEMGGLMGVQAGATTALGQQAEQGMGIREGYDADAIRANAVAAGISGAGMGAIFGALHPPQARSRARPNPDVQPDAGAALDAALNPTGPPPPPETPPTQRNPLATAPPPEPPPGGQREMFHPTQYGPTVRPGVAPEPPAPERTEFPPTMSPIDTGDRSPGLYAPQPPSPMLTEPPPGRAPAARKVEPGSPVVTAPTADPGLGMAGAEQPDLLGGAPTRYTPEPPPEGSTPPPPGPTPPPPGPKSAQRTSSLGGKAATGPLDITPYDGWTKQDLIDAVVQRTGVNVNALKDTGLESLKRRLANQDRRDGSTPTPVDTTVVTGEPPTPGVQARPQDSGVAPPTEETSLPPTSAGVGPTGHEILEDAGIAVGDTVTAPLKYKKDGTPHVGARPAIGEIVSVDGQHVTLKDASGKTWQARAEDLSKEEVDPLAATEPGAAGRFTAEQRAESEARIAKRKAELEAEVAATRTVQPPAEDVTPGVKPKAAEEAVATSKAKEVEEPVVTLVAKDVSKGRKKKPVVIVPEKGGPRAYVEGAEGGTREELAPETKPEAEAPVEKTPEELRREAFAAEARAEAEGQATADDSNLERSGIGKEELHARDADDAHVTAPGSRVEEVSGLGEEHGELGDVAPTRTVQAPAEADIVGGERVAGEETSGTMRSQLGETKEEAIARGTSLVARAKGLVRRMLAGDIGPEVADHIFGQQETEGRRRTTGYSNLAEVVTNLIKRAEDKEAEQALLTTFAKDVEGSPQKRGSLTKKLEKDLAEFGDERAQQLRDILDRLTDPAGAAADEAERMAERAALKGKMSGRKSEPLAHAPTSTGIDPRSANSLRVLTDSRLSANVEHAIRTSERYDAPFTDRDLARTIMQDPVVIAERPDLAALARQLYKLARDIPVYTARKAHEMGVISDQQLETFQTANAYGHYEETPGQEHILVNIDIEHKHGTHVETALHEMVHSAFSHYIEVKRRFDPTHRDIQALNAIDLELARGFREKMASGEFGRGVEATRRQAESVMYALSNEHELHTMLLTNADVQNFAAGMVASDGFRQKMAALGMGPRPAGRSVWSHFVDLVRKGLGFRTPVSASEYTLLDHIMRPVTDIAERAAKYNEKYLPRDPSLRANATPLAWSAHEAFGERASRLGERALDAVGDRIGPTKIRALLQTIHFDRLIDRHGSKFQDGDENHAKNIRTAQEHAQVASDRFLRTFAPRAGEITRELARHDDVAELMNDAGYARAALGTRDVAANAHLTTPEERAQLAALQTRYDTMPAEKQALYNKTRDFLEEKYAFERQAVADNLVNRFMPDASAAEKALMRTTVASKTKLDEFLKDPDNAAIADERKRIARGMAKLTRMGFVDGDYFPMRRYGDFVVEYGGTPEDPGYGMQFFEKPSEAAAFRNQQLAAGVPGVQAVRERNSIVKQREMRLSPVVDQMIEAVRKDPALRAHANQLEELAAHLQMQYASGWEKATARRRYVAGASRDVARAIGTDLQASGRRIGTIMHGGERDAAFERMKAFNDQRASMGDSDSTLRDQIYHELKLRFQNGDDLNHAGSFALARKASAFGYAQSMMSLSRVAVEAAEMHMKMAVFIGARHGFGRAMMELSRSLKDLAPSIVGKGAKNTLDALIGKPLSSVNYDFAEMARQRLLAKGYDGSEVNQMFRHFTDLGLFGNTEAASLRELSRPTTAGNLWDRFLEVSSATTHASDEMSRISGAWAAFRVARSKGVSVPDAIDFAENTLRKAPNYSLANRARITTEKGILGRAAAPIMQFKQYGINESWLIANLMRDSFGRGTAPAARKEAALQLAGTVMMHSLMAGALTWAADPARYLGGVYDLATGNKPRDRTLDMRAFLARTMGPTLGEIVGQGVPHMLGMDMSHRLGVNNMLNIPQLNGYTAKDWAEFGGHLALGASGEDVGGLVSGFASMMQGVLGGGVNQMLSGAKQALPRIIRDPIKAYDLAQRGVVDTRGKQILAPSRITPLDVAYQALGIAPSRVSEARMGRQAIVQAREQMNDARGKLVQRWLEADPGDRSAVWSEIAQYNASPKVNLGSKITRDQLLQQLNERRKGTQHPGAFGLRLPKASERQLMEYGAFANH